MPVRYNRLSSCLNGQSTSPVRRAGSNENAMKTPSGPIAFASAARRA